MTEAPYLLETNDLLILDSFMKADSVLNHRGYENIMCSVSGGADSDIMLDICQKVRPGGGISYVWFNTGLEYEATREHLEFLEQKYGIEIQQEKPVKSIPVCCKEYGQPFLSKYVSDMIYRLQRHGFRWEDRPYEELLQEYPRCLSALKWWCNVYDNPGYSSSSRFSIGRNKWLKEFLIANPPWFRISNKCCEYAKKKVSDRYIKAHMIDLSLVGVRKAEGGVRASAYKNCFSLPVSKASAEYRPLFWYTNNTKRQYEQTFGVTHSRCYTEYGMRRTGCVGCPYNREILKELSIIEQHEPRLYKAVALIFQDSYRYTRMYREFVQEHKRREEIQ